MPKVGTRKYDEPITPYLLPALSFATMDCDEIAKEAKKIRYRTLVICRFKENANISRIAILENWMHRKLISITQDQRRTMSYMIQKESWLKPENYRVQFIVKHPFDSFLLCRILPYIDDLKVIDMDRLR